MVAQYRDKRKAKGQWWFRFVKDGVRYEGHGYMTQADAQEAEVAKRRELQGLAPKTRTAITYLTVINAYLDHCTKATTSVHVDWVKGRIYKYFTHLLGIPVMDMTPAWVRRQMREWDRIASRKTVNRNLGLLKTVLSFAEAEELIPYNPIRRVKYLPEERTTPYVPPAEDILKVRMLATPIVKQMIDIATKTGIRKGEMLGLEWKDVDLPRRTFTVYTRKKRGGHRTPRPLAITEDLLGTLEFLRTRKRGPWVFADEIGRPYTRMGMTLPYLCDRAGVKRFNWHSLRHFASHLMLARGASLEQVQRQLGHERSTTTDRYARGLRGPDMETARLLEKPLESMQSLRKNGKT